MNTGLKEMFFGQGCAVVLGQPINEDQVREAARAVGAPSPAIVTTMEAQDMIRKPTREARGLVPVIGLNKNKTVGFLGFH